MAILKKSGNSYTSVAGVEPRQQDAARACQVDVNVNYD
jgi:hypothetical protein